MELEVLISTMNINSKKDNQTLLKKMNVKGKSLTISQTNKKGMEEQYNRIIYDNTKGLSKSRNLAINNSNADIILIADDDVIYCENYEEIIKKAYKENPDVDMIAFFVESKNPQRIVRKMKSGKVGLIQIFRISSFQLTFKLESIKKNNLVFDENFGAGTKNFCGEETIFLSDCIRKKLKMIYIDKKIGEVEQTESTWFNNKNLKEYFKVEKKIFKRISKKNGFILWIQFVVRKSLKYLIKGYI